MEASGNKKSANHEETWLAQPARCCYDVFKGWIKSGPDQGVFIKLDFTGFGTLDFKLRTFIAFGSGLYYDITKMRTIGAGKNSVTWLFCIELPLSRL